VDSVTVPRYRHGMKKVSLQDASTAVQGLWNPLVLGELNGQAIKLAKFEGSFDWHHHANEDEAFLVVEGSITIDFKDHSVDLAKGELLIVPRGVEHRPRAESEALVLLFEPSTTLNTGNVVTDKTQRSLHTL